MSQLFLDPAANGTYNGWTLGNGGPGTITPVLRPDDDNASYIQISNPTIGKMTYTCSPTTRGIPNNASSCQLTLYWRAQQGSVGGPQDINDVIVTGGVTTGSGTGNFPGTSWFNLSEAQTEIAWTPAKLNDANLEIGVNLPQWRSGAQFGFVTTLYALATFTLAAPTATTNAATNIGTSTATLNGTINPNQATTQFPVSYFFQWGPTVNYGNNTTTVTGQTGSSNINVSANITGLSPNTTYHFRVVATNADNTTNGSDLTFTTQSTDQILIQF